VASTFRLDLLTVYSAFVIVTVEVSLRTVAVAVRVVPCRVAETTTDVSAVTLKALSENVAVFAPAVTETLASTEATRGSELLKVHRAIGGRAAQSHGPGRRATFIESDEAGRRYRKGERRHDGEDAGLFERVVGSRDSHRCGGRNGRGGNGERGAL
jgi:hypothetical protein